MHTICFVLLDTARLYTERVPDVINAERAIMHVRRADLFPLSKPWDFEKRESFGRVRELLVAFADTPFLQVITHPRDCHGSYIRFIN
ncbi:hypothetical protein ALC56_07457 [Trachymyrmex septentrionalis]|uniref:Uncharacterized protein n=1 Tax=Trachymyrmex septentrionalis TaxID=34720 RepID=A0A195FDG3_9HYME|nr:hypothetical protein ALC56_07457 [Trachymyrmex septentrionalis]